MYFVRRGMEAGWAIYIHWMWSRRPEVLEFYTHTKKGLTRSLSLPSPSTTNASFHPSESQRPTPSPPRPATRTTRQGPTRSLSSSSHQVIKSNTSLQASQSQLGDSGWQLSSHRVARTFLHPRKDSLIHLDSYQFMTNSSSLSLQRSKSRDSLPFNELYN